MFTNIGMSLAVVSLVVMLLFYPTYRAITYWVVDRVFTWWEFLLIEAGTIILVVFLFHEGWAISTVVVLTLDNIFWFIEPSLREEWKKRHLQQLEDIEIEKYRHLIKEYPENPAYYTALGDVFQARERYHEAIAAYERAIALLPAEYRHFEEQKMQAAMKALTVRTQQPG